MKENSLMLALDTSTATLSVALLSEGKTIAVVQSQEERNHSVRLVHEIREMIRSHGFAMDDLQVVAAGKGPGSYTGIRIGVTAAKTIAWSLNIPLIGVSSLEAMALGAVALTKGKGKPHGRPHLPLNSATWIIPLMDARRGQVYTGLYVKEENSARESGLDCRESDGIRMLSDWLDRLTSCLHANEGGSPAAIVFVGDTSPFMEEIQSSDFAQSIPVTVMETQMDAAHIGWIAMEKWRRGEVEEIHSFIPNYTQLAEAEVKRLAKLKDGEA